MSNQKLKKNIKEEYDDEKRRIEKKKKENQKKWKKEQKKIKEKNSELEEIIYDKNELMIPIVKLVNVEIVKKEVEIDKNIPIINEEEREITIPIVKKEKLRIELHYNNFDENLPEIDTYDLDSKLRIPIIRLSKNKEIKTVLEDFNDDLPRIPSKVIPIPRIPLYRLLNQTELMTNFSSFDNSIENQFLILRKPVSSKDIREAKNQTIKEQIPNYYEDIIESLDNAQDNEYKIPIKILGINSKDFSGRPVIIFLNDSDQDYTPVLEYFCKRIYREIRGGKPEPRKITNIEDFKRILEFWLKAEGMIFTIDFQKKNQGNVDVEKLDWNVIRNELEQLYSQELGFIIFKNIKFEEEKHLTKEHRDITYLILNPNENLEKDFKIKRKICSLLWGFIKFNEEVFEVKPIEEISKFNFIFYEAKRIYDHILDNIREPYDEATRPHKGVIEESDTHYRIKRFVVKYISNELGYNKNEDIVSIKKLIHTEQKYSNNKYGEDYPDILINNSAPKFQNEAFEIETLFGEGTNPINKINKTIEKYEHSPIKKVNIVMDNLTLMRHLQEIEEKIILHKYQEEKRNFELEFWTLDLRNNKLISLRSFANKINDFEKGDFLPIFIMNKPQ